MAAAPRTAVMGAGVASTLVAEHLSVRRGDQLVIDDVSLEIKPLELHGLIGPNGAGKTTLLDAIAGFIPAVGDVMLGPVQLEREQRRQHIFYVPDSSASTTAPDGDARANVAFKHERVRDLLAFAAKSLGGEIPEIVSRLDIGAIQSKRMDELTKGERKRVMVAVGLLVPTGFVLLDEPFDGLDLRQMHALRTVLRTSTNEKRALLVSIHNFADAEQLCDRFTMLSNGKVVAAGPLHELRERAKTRPGAPLEEVFLALGG